MMMFLLTLAASSATAHAAIPLPLNDSLLGEGELQLGVAASYLDNKRSFDRNGDRAALENNGEFRAGSGTAFLKYGATRALTFYGGAQLDASEVVAQIPAGASGAPATPAAIDNTARGPGDAELGFQYRFLEDPIRLTTDASVLFPLYSRLSPDDWARLTPSSQLPLGNGITEIALNALLELPLGGAVSLGAGLGYTTRSSGFSSLLPFRAYVKFDAPRAFFARLGLAGQLGGADDQFASASPLPNDRSSRVIGGSQALNAVNPTAIRADAAAGVYLGSNLFINAGIRYPIAGKDIPADPVFLAALGLDLGGSGEGSGYSHSNRGFQQYYLAARVVVANNDLKQILIDKGQADGIIQGELLDVFEPDTRPGQPGATVARGRVLETGPTRSKIQILELFRQGRIEEGFVVRRPVH